MNYSYWIKKNYLFVIVFVNNIALFQKILNSLLDTTQNVSTKVISLQGEYAKISEQITTLPSLTEQVNYLFNKMNNYYCHYNIISYHWST